MDMLKDERNLGVKSNKIKLEREPSLSFDDEEKANEWGQKSFNSWQKMLSSSEKDTFYLYRSTEYNTINKSLRNGELHEDPRHPEMIKVMDESLKKARLPKDVILHRGAPITAISNIITQSLDETADFKKMNRRQIKSTLESLIENLSGKIITDKGFGSYSLTNKKTNLYLKKFDEEKGASIHFILNAPKGSNIAYIDSLGGTITETEMLAKTNTKCKIAKAQMISGNRIRIYADII